MIYTSNFAYGKNINDIPLVSISRYTPTWFENPHEEAKELSPSQSLLTKYKSGEINEAEYVKIFQEETLDKLDPHEIYKKYDGKVLLCYEKIGDFCHRTLIRDWLAKYKLSSKELRVTRLGVIGSRDYDNYKEFSTVMDRFTKNYTHLELVSGGARGADRFAEQYGREKSIPVTVYPIDWSKGRQAGFLRNYDIWNNIDLAIAFWDGKSRGTKHSFGIAKRQDKKLYVYDYIKQDYYLNQ